MGVLTVKMSGINILVCQLISGIPVLAKAAPVMDARPDVSQDNR